MWDTGGRIDKFGKVVRSIYDRKIYDLDTAAPENDLLRYIIQPLKATTKDDFLPSHSQEEYLLSIDDEYIYEKEYKKMYRSWRIKRDKANAVIQMKNIENSELIKLAVKRRSEMVENHLKVLSEVLDSISTDSKHMIEAWTRPFTELEINRKLNEILITRDRNANVTGTIGLNTNEPSTVDVYTIDHACFEGNFFFIFEAAFNTHVVNLDALEDDKLIVLKKQEQELDRLKSYKHVSGSFLTWRTSWRQILNSCRSTGKNSY
jgi:hypothetical protein